MKTIFTSGTLFVCLLILSATGALAFYIDDTLTRKLCNAISIIAALLIFQRLGRQQHV
jgi:hypothetical protein